MTVSPVFFSEGGSNTLPCERENVLNLKVSQQYLLSPVNLLHSNSSLFFFTQTGAHVNVDVLFAGILDEESEGVTPHWAVGSVAGLQNRGSD